MNYSTLNVRNKQVSVPQVHISSKENIVSVLLPLLCRCRKFAVSDSNGKISEIFLGCARASRSVTGRIFITYDCLRDNVGKVFDLNTSLVFTLRNDGVDIMFSTGYWLTCYYGGNYSVKGKSLGVLKFDKKAVMYEKKSDLYIVDLSGINLSRQMKDVVSSARLQMSLGIFTDYDRRTPYTIAYVKENDRYLAGCWDILAEEFLSKPVFPVKNFLT